MWVNIREFVRSCTLKGACAATFLTVLFSASAHAETKPTIYWLKWELSPEFIRYGEYAGQGFADHFLNFFMENLPEYNHEIQWVSLRRWHKEALKKNRCTPHIWKEFHLDHLTYSKRYMLTPPQMAIFHKRDEARLGPPGTVLSLQKLLRERQFTLLIPALDPKQIRYPILQKYIEPYLNSDQILQIGDVNEINLTLIERKRGDFAFGYPTVITSQRRDRGLGNNFIDYHLEEHQQYKNIHLACFGDDTGEDIVARINELMKRDEMLYFLGLYEDWNNKNPAFREAFTQTILENQ